MSEGTRNTLVLFMAGGGIALLYAMIQIGAFN